MSSYVRLRVLPEGGEGPGRGFGDPSRHQDRGRGAEGAGRDLHLDGETVQGHRADHGRGGPRQLPGGGGRGRGQAGGAHHRGGTGGSRKGHPHPGPGREGQRHVPDRREGVRVLPAGLENAPGDGPRVGGRPPVPGGARGDDRFRLDLPEADRGGGKDGEGDGNREAIPGAVPAVHPAGTGDAVRGDDGE